MKKMLLIALAGLLVSPFCLAQNENDITIPEFRQALLDSLSVLDSRRASEFEKTLRAATDDTFAAGIAAFPTGVAFRRPWLKSKA